VDKEIKIKVQLVKKACQLVCQSILPTFGLEPSRNLLEPFLKGKFQVSDLML